LCSNLRIIHNAVLVRQILQQACNTESLSRDLLALCTKSYRMRDDFHLTRNFNNFMISWKQKIQRAEKRELNMPAIQCYYYYYIIIVTIILSGARLSPLGTSAITGLLYEPQAPDGRRW
jgi:urease accessory protein UreF